MVSQSREEDPETVFVVTSAAEADELMFCICMCDCIEGACLFLSQFQLSRL